MNAPHNATRPGPRLEPPLLTRNRLFPAPGPAAKQILALRHPRGQRLRRPQPVSAPACRWMPGARTKPSTSPTPWSVRVARHRRLICLLLRRPGSAQCANCPSWRALAGPALRDILSRAAWIRRPGESAPVGPPASAGHPTAVPGKSARGGSHRELGNEATPKDPDNARRMYLQALWAG